MPPVTITAALRNAVSEWLAKGYAVQIGADGSVKIVPVKPTDTADAFDMIDMKR